MKVFKNLEIEVTPICHKDFISSVERGLPAGWTRDKEAESRSAGLGSSSHVYIICEKTDTRMSALVALMPKEDGGFYVSNIVPTQTGQLTHDEYNRIDSLLGSPQDGIDTCNSNSPP